MATAMKKTKGKLMTAEQKDAKETLEFAEELLVTAKEELNEVVVGEEDYQVTAFFKALVDVERSEALSIIAAYTKYASALTYVEWLKDENALVSA